MCFFGGKYIKEINFNGAKGRRKREDGSWKTEHEDGRRKREDGSWKTEDRRRKREDGSWKTEHEDGRRKREDGSWKTEDRRRKREDLGGSSVLSSFSGNTIIFIGENYCAAELKLTHVCNRMCCDR